MAWPVTHFRSLQGLRESMRAVPAAPSFHWRAPVAWPGTLSRRRQGLQESVRAVPAAPSPKVSLPPKSTRAVPAAPSFLWKAPCGMARAYQQAQPQHAYQQAQPQQPGVSAAQQSGRVGCWEPGSGWTHMVQPTFDTPWGSAPPPLKGGPPTQPPNVSPQTFPTCMGQRSLPIFEGRAPHTHP